MNLLADISTYDFFLSEGVGCLGYTMPFLLDLDLDDLSVERIQSVSRESRGPAASRGPRGFLIRGCIIC